MVKRAVLIAAGFGSRLVPITLNTPEAAHPSAGAAIIDFAARRRVRGGHRGGVRGARLSGRSSSTSCCTSTPVSSSSRTPSTTRRTISSSAVAAKDLLQNAYVFESDLLLYNPKLITKYQYSSNYLGVPDAGDRRLVASRRRAAA